MAKKIIALFFALGFVVLTGCNTIEGAGKDLEKGGYIALGVKKITLLRKLPARW